MKEVRVSTPGKLMLLGEHAVVYDNPCLVTGVDQRLFCQVEYTDTKSIVIDSPEVQIEGYEKSLTALGTGVIPKGARFVELAVRNFRTLYPFDAGLHIVTKSDFASTFGFGSSSAATVCTIKALSEIFEINLSNRELFDLSYKTVLDVQKVGSGFDIAAGIYGGTIYFKKRGEMIESLNIDALPLVIGYTGTKADTVSLINHVSHLRGEKPELVETIFEHITQIVEKGKIAFKENDLKAVGELMNENQKLLGELGVSTPKLDAMVSSAVENGAYGAKLSGAGGGDCMIALVPNEKRGMVKTAITKVGGEVLDVGINAQGVRKETI